MESNRKWVWIWHYPRCHFFIMTTNTCNYAAVNDAHSNRKKVLFNKMPLFSLLLFAFILQRTECEMSFIKMNAYVYFSLVKCKSARQCVHDAHDLFINSLLPALSMTSSVAQHKNNKKKRIWSNEKAHEITFERLFFWLFFFLKVVVSFCFVSKHKMLISAYIDKS